MEPRTAGLATLETLYSLLSLSLPASLAQSSSTSLLSTPVRHACQYVPYPTLHWVLTLNTTHPDGNLKRGTFAALFANSVLSFPQHVPWWRSLKAEEGMEPIFGEVSAGSVEFFVVFVSDPFMTHLWPSMLS